MSSFVHLHVHSEYSLLDGAARMNSLVQRAKELGMNALALTDHGVMYGAIPFYEACLNAGIKPIIGCEVYVAGNSMLERGTRAENPIYHLVLLAKNNQGYQNLMRLCSIAQLEGFHYRPRIDFERLQQHAEGLICLSGCLAGEVPQAILHGEMDKAREVAERYRALFGPDYFLEIQDHQLIEQKKVMSGLVQLSEQLNIPLVATNDVHYVNAQEAELQDVLICIGTGKTLHDEERMRFSSDQLYLKSEEEMKQLFPHMQDAISQTTVIANRCELKIDLYHPILPQYKPLPVGQSTLDYLKEQCEIGLQNRYAGEWRWTDEEEKKKLYERLYYEISVIGRMGYADYFLIVADFIRFAHEQSIPVGPGRGSAAGSLVAYVLRITDVDPIKYGLLFERFLNPERVSMPDIDIDFSDERRDEVIEYVVEKYGSKHVAQIITFGTMAARAAVRDVGRVLELPYETVDRVAKLIPQQVGMTIEQAVRQTPELAKLVKEDAQITNLLKVAREVEGFPRHASTHAAGLVISEAPLTDHVPLQKGNEQIALTQYAMGDLEKIGLMKMDFLGLRTLSIIERTLKWIKVMSGSDLDISAVPFDDALTYDMLSRGETTGVFQLESSGMRHVLRELKPSDFEDIISVLALYRPGPMEFIPNFIRAKHGEIQIDYPHPSLENILVDTHGVIVYQEQIMQIASQMAGFSLGEADLLRRAVSKKNRNILDKERQHFVEGSVKQGFSRDEASQVYDLIVRFADYGFPRAHAAAYGVLAYQTAYLKANHQIPFMAAMFTAWMGNARKIAEYVDECRRVGIAILPPDLNESDRFFTPVQEGIRFGLSAIKNIGTQAVAAILQARETGAFVDFLDFCQRVDLRVCNKKVIESLIQAGAMDGFPQHRAQLLDVVEEVVDRALKWKKQRDELQIELFDLTEEANWTIDYVDIDEASEMQRLEWERALLGIYVSGNPLDHYEAVLRQKGALPLHQLSEQKEQARVRVAGIIADCKQIITRKGQPMAFIGLEDRTERVEVVVFPRLWEQFSAILQKGELIYIEAKVQHDDEQIKLIADHVTRLDEVESLPNENAVHRAREVNPVINQTPTITSSNRIRSHTKQKVYIRISSERETADRLKRLQFLLQQYPGDLDVVLYYEHRKQARKLGAKYRVKPSPELFQRVNELLGPTSIRVL